jgi:hypothetical protein
MGLLRLLIDRRGQCKSYFDGAACPSPRDTAICRSFCGSGCVISTRCCIVGQTTIGRFRSLNLDCHWRSSKFKKEDHHMTSVRWVSPDFICEHTHVNHLLQSVLLRAINCVRNWWKLGRHDSVTEILGPLLQGMGNMERGNARKLIIHAGNVRVQRTKVGQSSSTRAE